MLKENLTPRQLKAVEALVTCADVRQAAAVAGVSRDTIYRWMRNEAFKEALNTSTRQAVNRISRQLISLGDKAVDTLQKAMASPEVSITVSIRAADIVLSRLLQIYELADLEARLGQLERSAKDEKNQKPY